MRFFVALLLVALIVVGYMRGWFQVGVNDGPNADQSTASVTVNKAKIHEDVTDIAQKTREQVNSFSNKPRAETSPNASEGTARGQIDNVGQGRLTVRMPDDQMMTFGLAPKTEIHIGDRPATVGDLQRGDPVSVIYSNEQEGHMATSVTVENRN